jgi:CO/xanthine dehydrogenase FAD-binding subunit
VIDARRGNREVASADPAALGYALARSVDEALSAVAAGATLLAGGTLLAPLIAHKNLAGPFVDISRIPELGAIRQIESGLEIGALVTHAELAASAEVASALPALQSAARSIGNPQVRAAGTVGGNVACRLARASLPAVLLVLGAEAIVQGPARSQRADPSENLGPARSQRADPSENLGPARSQRADPSEDANRGERRALPIDRVLREGVPQGSMIVAVRVPIDASRRAAYVKFAWRHTSAKALAAVAVSCVLDGQRIVSPRIAASALCIARRLSGAESLLDGRTVDDDAVAEVARAAAAEPPYAVDVDAVPVGETYRRRLVRHGVASLLHELVRA